MLGPAGSAAATSDPLGPAPRTSPVQHFRNRGFVRLRWTAVSGATSYQVFVKSADFDRPLPVGWRLLKSVQRTATTVFVPLGQTRQYGVRAVGAPDGAQYQVTAVAGFGTVSRPPRVQSLTGVRHWHVVRSPRMYRRMALETTRPGSNLWLRPAKDTATVQIIGESGHRFGSVEVHLGRRLLRRIDFGAFRHRYVKRIRIRVRPTASAPIRITTTSRKPVRISVLGQTRLSTRAVTEPPAPLAYPPASSFTVTGAGWGHGVGLSQYGAEAMARAGKTTSEILGHYYEGTAIGTAPDNGLIDVNVGYHRSETFARLRGLADGAVLEVCAMSGDTCTQRAVVHDPIGDATPSGQVALLRHGSAVRARVRDEDGQLTRLTGAQIRLRWSGTRDLPGPASVLRLGDGDEFRHGELLVLPYGTGSINDVVRERLQDEYLPGVAEVPSSWDPAALRAQAIIARTYALKDGASLRSSCACNLRNSVVDQNYTGWAKENEGNGYYGQRWIAAVHDTAGEVVTYDGQLASTYYFSSSGGHTLNSQDVWSADVPYLQSVDDPWSMTADNPNRSWTTTLSQDRVASIFGFPVHALRVDGTYQGGAMSAVTAIDESGQPHTISGKADDLRAKLGLKSDWVTSIQESYQ